MYALQHALWHTCIVSIPEHYKTKHKCGSRGYNVPKKIFGESNKSTRCS